MCRKICTKKKRNAKKWVTSSLNYLKVTSADLMGLVTYVSNTPRINVHPSVRKALNVCGFFVKRGKNDFLSGRESLEDIYMKDSDIRRSISKNRKRQKHTTETRSK